MAGIVALRYESFYSRCGVAVLVASGTPSVAVTASP